MKYLITSILVLLVTITSCSKAGQKESQQTSNDTDIAQNIDTITVRNENTGLLFDDATWLAEALQTLRQNKIPCEVVMVGNAYSEIQDSMLVFTSSEFRYGFLKVNHMNKLILEYLEENNLNNRTPIVKGLTDKVQLLADEMKTERSDEYIIHADTESGMSDLFLQMKDGKLVAAKFLGWVD